MDAAHGGPPRVSVIVRTKDRPRLLAEALDSLRRQTMTDFETVLVNDGSASAVERAVGDTAPGRSLRVVTPGPPGGRSRALNAGVAAARGRFVAYLDDDDLFLPEHLETLARFLEGSDEYRVAYTAVEQIEQTLGADGGYHDGNLRTTYGHAYEGGKLLSSNYIPIIALMHERALVNEVGGFDETFDLFEDWDFLIRLSAAHRFHHIPKVTAVYRVRDDGSNATSSTPWLGEKSQQARRQLFDKHWSRRTVVSEMALVDGWARESWTLGQSLAAKDGELRDLRSELAVAHGRLKKAESEILDFRADAARQTQASGEREAALAVENTHLRSVVTQMTSSVAWRLFTPWWKLKGLLKK